MDNSSMPKKGKPPTGIFSSHGKQKMDPLAPSQRQYSNLVGSAQTENRIDPKPRNNMLKK